MSIVQSSQQTAVAVKVPRLLFADPDTQFLQSILSDRKSGQFQPIVAQIGSEAMAALSDHKTELAGVFIGMGLVGPDALSVVRAAHQLRPAVPIYLISDGRFCPWDEDTLRKMGVHGLEQRGNFTFSDIAKKFYPPALLFDADEAIETARRDPAPAGKESVGQDDEYVPISARTFLAGRTSFFDVYIRISEGRFLKIVRGGEEFSSDRLTTYLKNGVEEFHIRRNCQEQYLGFCDKLLGAIVASPTLAPTVQISQAVSQGEKILDYLGNHSRFDAEHLQFASSYLQQLMTLIDQMKIRGQSEVLEAFMSSETRMEHPIAVTVLASLLGRALGFETKKSLTLIGIASFFHDIALFLPGTGISVEDESLMNAEQKKTYHQHPTVGARLLEAIPGIDAATAQTVANHHRRRNGTGFPRNSASTRIPVPAEIVGIADEYVRLICRPDHPSPSELEAKLVADVFPGFSAEVADAMRKVLKLSE